MRVYLRYGRSHGSLPAEVRLARFKRVLLAAQNVYGYRKYLRAAGLANPDAVKSLGAVESILPLLPITDIGEFRNSPAEFENAGAFPPGPRPFLLPLRCSPRTAVLMPGFEQTKSVKVLPPNWALLTQFRPEALAASVGVLRMLAKAIDNGRGRLPSLQYAVVAFTGQWSDGLLAGGGPRAVLAHFSTAGIRAASGSRWPCRRLGMRSPPRPPSSADARRDRGFGSASTAHHFAHRSAKASGAAAH